MTTQPQAVLPSIDDMLIESGQEIRQVKGEVVGFIYPPAAEGRQQMIEWQMTDVEVTDALTPWEHEQYTFQFPFKNNASRKQVLVESIKDIMGAGHTFGELKGQKVTITWLTFPERGRTQVAGEWINIDLEAFCVTEINGMIPGKDTGTAERLAEYEASKSGGNVGTPEAVEELSRDELLLELAVGQTIESFQRVAFQDSRVMKNTALFNEIVEGAEAILAPFISDGKLVVDEEGVYGEPEA